MKIAYIIVVFLCLFSCNSKPEGVKMVTVESDNLYYYMDTLTKPFQVMFLSDTHFTIEDERGRDFYPYTRRMGGAAVEPENYGISNGNDNSLRASLEKARKAHVELVILGGDIINFPSKASVETLYQILEESGLKWVYVSGNHDWHYEGESGEASVLRNQWQERNLFPLYQGNHPLYSSVVLHGINFVQIDNSTHEITEEQLSFFKEQLKQKYPIVLSMHVPLYLEGHNIDYSCGHPDWNKAHDPYAEIEGREPWPEEGHTPTTYAFCETVWNSPSVIGVLAGHTHTRSVDFYRNKIQYVSGANRSGEDVLIHFIPSRL